MDVLLISWISITFLKKCLVARHRPPLWCYFWRLIFIISAAKNKWFQCVWIPKFNYPPTYERLGKVLFSQVCVCPQRVSHLNPIILPTSGPLSFPGGTSPPYHNTSTGCRSLRRGYPNKVMSQDRTGGTSPSSSGLRLGWGGRWYPGVPLPPVRIGCDTLIQE